jgi:hypothetical protein
VSGELPKPTHSSPLRCSLVLLHLSRSCFHCDAVLLCCQPRSTLALTALLACSIIVSTLGFSCSETHGHCCTLLAHLLAPGVQNSEGDTGLLPSNHLEVVSGSEQPPDAARYPAGELSELPSAAVRRRVKEICDTAEIAKELHSLTYMRVKNQLIEEFGEALFSCEKEHVKEMIRRTESRLRVKHDSSTAHHARRAIAHAQQRRARKMFASRATDIQKRRSRLHLDDDDDDDDDHDEPHEKSPLLAFDKASKSPETPRRSNSRSSGDTKSPPTAERTEATPQSSDAVRRMPSREAIEQVPAPPPVKRRVRQLQAPPARRAATGRIPTAADIAPPPPPPRPSLASGLKSTAAAAVASVNGVCAGRTRPDNVELCIGSAHIALRPSPSLPHTHTRARACTHTHTRARACTHTHTHTHRTPVVATTLLRGAGDGSSESQRAPRLVSQSLRHGNGSGAALAILQGFRHL